MQTFKPRWSRSSVRDVKAKNVIFGKKCHYGLVPKISGENVVRDANLAAEAIFGTNGTDPSPLPQLRATPVESARARLAKYRDAYGAQMPEQWLEHAKRAVEAVRATFPPDRRDNVLKGYIEHYCEGQSAQVIAAHTIALELWALDNRQRPNGVWLAAACQAVGLDIDYLPEVEHGIF